MNEQTLEQELRQYLDSEEFQNDCTALRAFYRAFYEETPGEDGIKQEAVNEKKIYFEAVYLCMTEGHDWKVYEEEIVGRNVQYQCCQRCGLTEEINGSH